jgi:hypothetical protein
MAQARTRVADSFANDPSVTIASIDRLQELLTLAKTKLETFEDANAKADAETRTAAEVAEKRAAKRKRRDEAAAGFTVRDELLGRIAPANARMDKSSDASITVTDEAASSEGEEEEEEPEVVQARPSKRPRRG